MEIQLFNPQDKLLDDYRSSILAAIAGTGGGKTTFGYLWLATRMEKMPGYGWAMAEPTYPMLAKIILNSPDPERPTLLEFLMQIGYRPRYKAVDKIIETNRGKIYLGSADNPDSMQGASVKGYWLDEAGQMRLLAYETALQRVSMQKGQILLTSMWYAWNWLKTEVVDHANEDRTIHIERWRSIDRPGFPVSRYEEMKRRLPPWRFAMLYDGILSRPEGLIYSSFDENICKVSRFVIPLEWPVYVGMDFGGVHTAAIFFAKDPATGNFYAYREYLAGERTAAEHANYLKFISKNEQIFRIVGGSASEQQWRDEFAAVGWHVSTPRIADVEMGISSVYGLHKQNRIFVFDDLKMYLDEKNSYSREYDEAGQVTEKIANKEAFHLLDAERYILSDILGGRRAVFEI